MSFTVFIDESGDAGVQKIRAVGKGGATPYMVLSAVLVADDAITTVEKLLRDVRQELGGKDLLHCSKLTHEQKVFVCTKAAAVDDILAFGVISKKATLGWYNNAINQESWRYYNKCSQYLLEKIGKYAAEKNIRAGDIRIIFEKGNFKYGPLRSFIKAIQRNPLHDEAKLLRNLDASNIESRDKDQEDILQLADLFAHALFKCVDKTKKNFEIPEPKYFELLRPRFYANSDTGAVVDYGIKFIHTAKDVGLDQSVLDIFQRL